MQPVLPRVAVALLASVLVTVGIAEAGVSPFWRALGPSTSGNGVSQTSAPRAVLDVSVAVGGDGRPVVAYTQAPDATARQGAIVVKRWTGSSWQTLSAGVGQGHRPQVRVAPSGAIVVAWVTDDAAGNTEIRLRVRTGPAFVALGESDSSGGLAGAGASITGRYALALDAAGNPAVAFMAAAGTTVTVVGASPAVLAETPQVYVRRWNGSAWEFLGSDFTGGGASSAASFLDGGRSVVHVADSPALAFDAAGNPVVAFTYFTAIDDGAVANTDVHVTRWTGAVWTAVGAPVPAGATPEGLGAASGVSASDTGSFNPSLAAGASGRLALAWEEDTPTGTHVRVRVWNGLDAWEELAGSATGSGFTLPGTVNTLPQVALDGGGRPVVAWQATVDAGAPAQVFVRRWNGTDAWVEVGLDSASGAGISDALVNALAPSVALTPPGGTAEAGVPAVAWLDARDGASSQVFLRQYYTGPTEPLAVTVQGDGAVTSNPIGVACTGACVAEFPRGTVVTLVPQGGADAVFDGWTGHCSGSRTCTVTLGAPRSVNASFVGGATLAVDVVSAGGRVSSSPAGIASCTGSCSAKFETGTRVTLTAALNTGGSFTGWGGACAFRGTNTTCPLTLEGNTSVSAAFGLRDHRLSVVVTGAGTGFTVSDPAGIDCGGPGHAACTSEHDYGTLVRLTPVLGADSMVTSWSGCSRLNGSVCQVLLTANRTVTLRLGEARTLHVSASGNGSGSIVTTGLTCASNCSESRQFPLNSAVTLTPRPATGSSFQWTGGDCSGRAACRLVMSDNRSAAGEFTLNRHALVVVEPPGGRIASLPPLPGGTIDCGGGGAACSSVLDWGTPVALQATAAEGFVFVRWTGATCAGGVTGSTCAFPLRANVTVRPTFRARTVVTLVKDGTGAGIVSGPGISCGADCEQALFDARPVRLTARPTVGTSFAGFGGACVSNTSICTFVPTGDAQMVTASFSLQSRRLRVTVVGEGSVSGNGFACDAAGTPCEQDFDYGTLLPLTPTPASGYRFTGWSGSCSGASPTTCKPLLTLDRSVTATFRPVFGLSVVKSGNSNTGTMTSSPAGIKCGVTASDCSEDYLGGTKVTLSRSAPPTGTVFRWLGDCAFRGTNASCALTMDANHSVDGEYRLIPLGLTVRNTGAAFGTVARAGGSLACGATCVEVIDYGTLVTLVASPAASPASEFVAWTGCTPATNASCTFPLTANRTVTASFRPLPQSLAVQSIATGTLAIGATRQLTALATFTDGSQQDVTALTPAISWMADPPGVVSVSATGLVTGKSPGNASVWATFERGGRLVVGTPVVIVVDTLVADDPDAPDPEDRRAIRVTCEPYAQPGGELTCLPSGVSFEVHCRAFGRFTQDPDADVDITDQVTWVSTSNAIARPTGLVAFLPGGVRQSFRIVAAGTARLYARLGTRTSQTTGTPGTDAWAVQSANLGQPVGLAIEPQAPSVEAGGSPLQLRAMATFGPTAACPAPPPRDASLLVTWTSDDEAVAEVSFFGAVTGLTPGGVNIGAAYVRIEGGPLADSVPVNVTP